MLCKTEMAKQNGDIKVAKSSIGFSISFWHRISRQIFAQDVRTHTHRGQKEQKKNTNQFRSSPWILSVENFHNSSIIFNWLCKNGILKSIWMFGCSYWTSLICEIWNIRGDDKRWVLVFWNSDVAFNTSIIGFSQSFYIVVHIFFN